MDDLKSVVSSLCKSPYLDEWILKLKDNEVLFSPKRNIKPCIRIDDKYVKSNYWLGLNLLEIYSRSQLLNNEVDEFIVKLLNESIETYKSDKEEDPYKRLNSSDLIVTELFEICIQRKKYFEAIDVVSLIEFSLNSVTSWPFTIVHSLYEHKNVLLECSSSKVFEVYKTILEFGGKSLDYKEYLKIDDLIKKIPYKYYDYCKSKILTYDFSISSMGSFFEYQGGYEKEKETIIFDIFKTASREMAADILKEDVKNNIFSNSKLLKRIGLCLININYDKISELFFNYIDVFFNDDDFYSDLRCFLENNVRNITNANRKDLIVSKIKSATFGINKEREKLAVILRNYLAMICSHNGLDIPFVEPSKSDIEYVLNYNKSFYVVDHDFNNDIDIIKNRISDLTIDNSVDIYFELIKGSSYFKDTVRRAFIEKYFSDGENIKNIRLFDHHLAVSLIHYHQDKKNVEILYDTIYEVLNICEKNHEFTNCLSSILFAIQSNVESFGLERYCKIMNIIDYKWISIGDFKYSNEIISECINEEAHSYLEMLAYAVEKNGIEANTLKTIIDFYLMSFDSPKTKAIITYIVPRLLRIDTQYTFKIIDSVFDNWFNNTNPSYTLLAISNGYSPKLLESICYREDFKAYLNLNNDTSDEKMAQKVLFNWVLGGFFFFGKYEELLDVEFNKKRIDAILENIRNINYWIEVGQLKTSEQLLTYLSKLNNLTKNITKKDGEIDQLIRELSRLVVLTNGEIDLTWHSLIQLFNYFDHFFSDECYELIKKFKNAKKEFIIEILDIYFGSYEQYKTYESTLKKVFKLIDNDTMYKDETRRWRVSIVNKNPEFDFESRD